MVALLANRLSLETRINKTVSVSAIILLSNRKCDFQKARIFKALQPDTLTFLLFPLDGRRRLAGDVVYHTSGAADFIYDSCGDSTEQRVGQGRVFARHEIRGTDGAQGDRVVICAEIAYDTDRAAVGQYREILIRLHPAAPHLFPENRVRVLEDPQLFLCDLADDPHAETGTRERLPVDKRLWKSELSAKRAHLILEQSPQRFNDTVKLQICRETADIVMTLDRRRLAAARFDHVRVDRPLR